MKKSIVASVSLGMILSGMVTVAQAGSVNYYFQEIYQAGSNWEGQAVDSTTGLLYDYDGGFSSISWSFDVELSGYATLSITAEGIDSGTVEYPDGEVDRVSYRIGTSGEIYLEDSLDQQGFYSSSSDLLPGAGGVANITAVTTSVFDLGFLEAGTYTFTVHVPEGIGGHAWVNEIETSSLTVTTVPTQTSMLLLGTGLVGLAAVGRRKQA